MAIVEAYVANAILRRRYFEMNGIDHVEAWPSDHGYTPALCAAPGEGWPERDLEFSALAGVASWSRRYCPELPFRGLEDIPLAGEVNLA